MLYLVVTSGIAEGASWGVGEQSVLVGREPVCDISLADSLVSRRHCEMRIEGDRILLKDLESRNTTLVNGTPVVSADLVPGDELTIGRTTFAICENPPDTTPPKPTEQTTRSISEGEALYLVDRLEEKATLEDTADIVRLYRFGGTFTRATSPEALVEALAEALNQRFTPEAYWVVRMRDAADVGNTLAQHRVNSIDWDRPDAFIQQALGQRAGIIVPEHVRTASGKKTLRLTLVAPLFFGDRVLAVVALQSRMANRVYDERDLHFLVSLAHTAAPCLAALEQRESLETEVARLRAARKKALELVGSSDSMKQVRRRLRQAAPSELPVLISGETGTGKEIAAHLIHELSNRNAGPIVSVNCAAIPNELFGSELFGHEKGAFTGANQRRKGLIEACTGGTLFLDEVGDLSLDNQARILRVLESKRFRRIGGNREHTADFRLVAATNRDLERAIADGQFRDDLYHRLCGIALHIPPLREHPEDIPELANHFLEQARAHSKHPIQGFEEAAPAFLKEQPWPGNGRQLRHCVEAAMALNRSGLITAGELRASVRERSASRKPPTLAEMERRLIEEALDYCGGNVVEAAQLLGVGKDRLYRRLAEYRKDE